MVDWKLSQNRKSKMKRIIHSIAIYLRKWYSIAIVIFISQYALDYLVPGIGHPDSTNASVIINVILSFWMGVLFMNLMNLIVNKTYPEYISLIGSNKILNELLQKAIDKK